MHPVLARADEVAVMADPKPITLTGKSSGAVVRSINLDARVLRPDSTWSKKDGNTVYFGKYDNTATAYRVLSSPGTQTNTADYLLFDCDTAPIDKKFDEDGKANSDRGQTNPNEWNGSDLESWLNGNEFYESSSVFSALEKAAIADTELSAQKLYDFGSSWGWSYQDFAATDHVFCLSAKEVFWLYAGNPASRKGAAWWLRSAESNGRGWEAKPTTGVVGYVTDTNQSNGYINCGGVNNATLQIKVSPAFNVSPAAILFASESGMNKSADLAAVSGSAVKAWKLTLLDSGKTVKVTEGQSLTRQDSTITVPYTYTDSNTANPVSQISVMITDQPYKDSGAKVLYYGALQNVTNISETSGTGTFTLPPELVEKSCGTDYYVYIIAEDANGATETDYAGEPVQISALPATTDPAITTQPVGVSVKAGGTAAFTVAASGDYLTYQWKISKDNGTTWEDISGANTASYTISSVSKDSDGFWYRCVVSNSQGTSVVESDSATLTVQDAGGSNPGSSGGSSGSGSSGGSSGSSSSGSSGSSNTPSKPDTDYRVISGAESSWTAGSSEGLTIRGSGEYSKFIGVKVDGKLLDRSHYTVKEGSTIITLKTAYLNTLAVGKHTVEILWTDGSASITLHIRSSQLLPFVVAIKTAAITKALRIIMQHQVFRNFLVMA